LNEISAGVKETGPACSGAGGLDIAPIADTGTDCPFIALSSPKILGFSSGHQRARTEQ
jgi:hypothetical protein